MYISIKYEEKIELGQNLVCSIFPTDLSDGFRIFHKIPNFETCLNGTFY